MTVYANDDAYPFKTVAFIEARFGSEWATGSGVLVGRNDLLTASHVVYDPLYGLADEIRVTFSYRPGQPGDNYVVAFSEYYKTFDPDKDGLLYAGDGKFSTLGGSELDIALLSLAKAAGDRFGWMGMDFAFDSGPANVTGHPTAYKERMTNDTGYVFQDGVDNYIDINDMEINPGNSGGPVWHNGGGNPYVIGVVSTSVAAVSLAAHETWLKEAIAGNDYLIGGNAHDGGPGDDRFVQVAGGGIFNGFGGTDTIVLPGERSSYSIELREDGSVSIRKGDSFTLLAMERAEFQDGTLLFGIDDPDAASIYRLYAGAFDRRPDEGGFLYWADWLDGGRLQDVATRFIASKEFVDLYGIALTDAQFVDRIYQNVLHRAGDPGGVAFWNGFLRDGDGDRAEVLTRFTQEREYFGATQADIDDGFWVI